MKKFIGQIILTTLFISSLQSQTTVKIDLLRNSWLAINGNTNVLAFRFTQSGEKILGKSVTTTTTQQEDKLYLSQNQLIININDFSSDNTMALHDFKKLLKADTYPVIKVELNFIETLTENTKVSTLKGNALVNITITGVTKQYSIPVSVDKHDETALISGEKSICIRDFGLEPPSRMFGLIKVNDWININFHLNCKLTVSNKAP